MSDRILVIQLARTGDVIQTTPLLADLHRSNPEAKIDLLVLAGNDTVVEGMPGIGRVITLPEADMQRMNEEVAQAMGCQGTAPLADAWLSGADLPAYAEVYNVSAQWLGCWVMSRLQAGKKVGGIVTTAGEWIYTCDWGTYLPALLDFRPWNRVNLVDLFRGFAPRTDPPAAGFRPHLTRDSRWASGLPPGVRIGFNPGASEPQRRYAPAAFVEVIRRCRERGHLPVLLGAPMDRALCDDIAASCGGIPNFAGRTTIPEMAQLLSELSLVVSNDTGAVHMAAAVGTPVVGLFGVSAFFHETGPWGEGHLVLQAPLGDQAVLLDAISPELVMAAIEYRLGRGSREGFLDAVRGCPGVEAWQSERIVDPTDPLGGVRYVPVSGESPRGQEGVAQRLRRFIACHLDRPTEGASGSGSSASSVPPTTEAPCGNASVLVGRLETLAARARRLQALASSDPESSILKTSVAQLQGQIDQALRSEPEESPRSALLALTRWKLRMIGAEGGLAGVLDHQRQVLDQAAGWIRTWD